MKARMVTPDNCGIKEAREQLAELKALLIREAEKEQALIHKAQRRGSEWRKRGRN